MPDLTWHTRAMDPTLDRLRTLHANIARATEAARLERDRAILAAVEAGHRQKDIAEALGLQRDAIRHAVQRARDADAA